MKAVVLLLLFTFLAAGSTFAQTASANPGGLGLATRLVPGDVGPHHQTWLAAPSEANRSGTDRLGPDRAIASPRLVTIGSGMNYWDGEKWASSDPSFSVSPEGDAFVADKLHYKVRLQADDLNLMGSVTVTTPQGHVLRSTPVAIGLYDAQSGESLILASIKTCSGVLIRNNQVVYEDAFNENGVRASVVFTAEPGSFATDVVLTAPLDPADYGFPAETSRIQIYTEYYGSHEPERVRNAIRVETDARVRARMASPDLVDETLGFGEFVFSGGRVYATGTNSVATGAAVAKEFKTVEQRSFLVESVEYPAIREGLRALGQGQKRGASIKSKRDSKTAYAAIPRAVERVPGATPVSKRSRAELARITPREINGLVIDPVATIDGNFNTTKVFQGDTTYFVKLPVYCNGSAIIEGGAVFKYPNSTPNAQGQSTTTFIQFNSTVTCKSGSYRPAICTAADDDSLGVPLTTAVWSRYTGSTTYQAQNGTTVQMYYANPALKTSNLTAPALNNLRIAYAQEGIQLSGTSVSATISHVQFLRCIRGIVLTAAGSGSEPPPEQQAQVMSSRGGAALALPGGGGSGTLSAVVKNALFAFVNYPFSLGSGTSGSGFGTFQNCTFHQATTLAPAYSGFSLTFNNCVLANISSLGTGSRSGNNNGFYATTGFGTAQFTPDDGNSPFLPAVAGGAYYLRTESGFRNKGSTTGLSSDFIADLRKRTTYPPSPPLVGTVISEDTTLPIQAYRDSDAIDLGYHYEPTDYIVSSVALAATLKLSEGVAVGIMGDYGFDLQNGAHFLSTGTPLALNRVCFYGNVQESPSGTGQAAVLRKTGWSDNTLRFRFTDLALRPGETISPVLSVPNGLASGELSFRDCQLRGCNLSLNPSEAGAGFTVGLTNNLVEYSELSFTRASTVPVAVFLYNNLFRSNSMTLSYTEGGNNPTWVVRDNLFYGTPQTFSPASASVSVSFNGFISGTPNSLGGTEAKTELAPDFKSGPLGDYYYPSTGALPSLAGLINADFGRTAAAAGMFHYTVKNDPNDKEGTDGASVNMDIGYHYVSTTASGVPVDFDGDGIADFEEDSNGNGIETDDPTRWLWYNSQNGLSTGNGLTVFTPIK